MESLEPTDVPAAGEARTVRKVPLPAPVVPDVVLGAGLVLGHRAAIVGRLTGRVARPVVHVLMHPPLVPPHRHPARVVEALARRGRAERAAANADVQDALMWLVPALAVRILELLPLTDLVRRNVDLNALVAEVDVDTIASRLDVNAVAARIDIDAIAARIDVDDILDRVDLTAVVRERVDLDAVVSDVALEPVINRIDLVALTEQVLDAIDLPEIIRESTGSVASEAVRGVRMQSIEADEVVSRVVDRLLLRRRGSVPDGPDS